jgi:hypothetical protein
MNCQPCGKRLSRKTARQINGVIMCSTCMFRPAQAMSAGTAETQKAAQGEARQRGPKDASNLNPDQNTPTQPHTEAG